MMGTVSELCASSFQAFLCPTVRPAATKAEILDRERGNLVERLNEANIKRLVDILFSQKVINQFEKETIMETHGRADKARVLVDMTYAKGEHASWLMINQIKVVDLMLYNDIFLKWITRIAGMDL